MIVSVLSAAVVFASLHEPDTAKYLMGKVCHCRLRWCGARTILCNTFRSGALLVRSEPCLVFISIRHPTHTRFTNTVHVHAVSLPRALLVCLRCCPACVAVSTWVQHALTFHSCLFTEAEMARVYLFTHAHWQHRHPNLPASSFRSNRLVRKASTPSLTAPGASMRTSMQRSFSLPW